MDELDLQKAISNLALIQKSENAKELNKAALAGAAGFGDKKAFSQIKKITKDVENEHRQINKRNKIEKSIGKKEVPIFDMTKVIEEIDKRKG